MLRDEFVHTPSEFVQLIKVALRKQVNVFVEDLIAIPDYVAAFKGCIDKDFQRMFKQEWTQHQVIFEKSTNPRDRYGVKMTYQPYAQSEVMEVVQLVTDEEKQLYTDCITGYIPQQCRSTRRPLPTEAPLNPLIKKPNPSIRAAQFVPKQVNRMRTVAAKMVSSYGITKPEVAREWTNWLETVAPSTNNVTDYVKDNPISIPFYQELFGSVTVPVTNDAIVVNGHNRPLAGALRIVENTTCVLHAGHKAQAPPRVIIKERDGSVPTKSIGVLPSIYPERTIRNKRSVTKKVKFSNNDQSSSSEEEVDPTKKKTRKRTFKKVKQPPDSSSDQSSSSSEEEVDEHTATIPQSSSSTAIPSTNANKAGTLFRLL